jgi:rare lipoprotein A
MKQLILTSLSAAVFTAGLGAVAYNSPNTKALASNTNSDTVINTELAPKGTVSLISNTSNSQTTLIAQAAKNQLGERQQGFTKIYVYPQNDLTVATLYVENIPILTFLGSVTKNTDTNATKKAIVIEDMSGADPSNLDDPVNRAKLVGANIDRLYQEKFDASRIKVSWNASEKSFLIKADDRNLVTIDDRTILADTTKNPAEDALQATNRFRRLIGNAAPLKNIEGLPKTTNNTQKPLSKVSNNQNNISLRVRSTYSGVASWYGPGFHGHSTANGEKFNKYDFTAAHRTLPFGTKVRVTNTRTGRSVIVRINDRGPYSGGRIIDLSYGAAKAIGLHNSGTAYVRLEVLGR